MLKYCRLTSPILPLTRTQLSLPFFFSSLSLSRTLIMDPRKPKQLDIDLDEDPISQVDDNWRAESNLLRIRNKAVLARVLYKRTDANTDELNESTKEKVTRALLDAKCLEEWLYTQATDELDYQTSVRMQINFVPNTSDTIQAAIKVTSDVPKDQLLPDLSEESSSEGDTLNIWILLESLSRVEVSTRAQNWPHLELIFALIGCHTRTINTVLLAFIVSHANTIYAAQQQYQPSSFLYLDALVQSIRSIKIHLQEQPPLTRGSSEGRIFSSPLQQEEGLSEFQKELHDEIMAFVDQIK